MSEIKLEVGKTFRSRNGEEVKITGFAEGIHYPYKGNKGMWYRADGRWGNAESPQDLIAEVPETSHTFQIPDGVKEVTVEQVGNRIVVEMVPEVDAAERCRIMDYLQRYGNNVKWSHEQLCWLIESYLKHKESEQ